MKPFFKLLLKYYLKYIAKLAILIHRPTIIAVAGSINKPFVKDEIIKQLKFLKKDVRANAKNFNTEIGLPLAVLYLNSGYNSFRNWLPVILKAPKRIFTRNFPKFIVLGLGTSDPGDMKYLLSIVKPQIAIITDITQRYLEGFTDMDSLFKEYKILVKKITKNGILIANNDNQRCRDLFKPDLSIISVGENENSNYQLLSTKKDLEGMTLEYKANGKIYNVKINKFGKHHIQAFLIGQIIKNYVSDKPE